MTTSLGTLKIGISACLLGQPVRFNGGHKESRLCSEVLARHFQFVPVCPEVAIGLGTPRQAIRLVGEPEQPRAVGWRNAALDVSDALGAYGRQVAAEADELCGFILMQKSPSCGMERVKVYRDDGQPAAATGRGLFAAALMDARPDLPVEEDGRLNDPVLRENFITRVYVYAAWQRLLRGGLSRRALYDFHARYKYQLMATSRAQYRDLGRMLAENREPLETFAPRYFSALMTALRRPASRGSHSNVLQHLSGYLKRSLSTHDRQEMQELIERYRQGQIPLVVPLTLLKHHLRHHPDGYLADQAYLQPHPEDLSLRNTL